jgi:CPA1 family monovalent cation:H+ antiporter
MIFTLFPIIGNFLKLAKVSLGYQAIMFWGGLKGGLAVAIALSLPVDLPGREPILGLTFGVVLFTLLVNANTIRPLMKLFNLDKPDLRERLEYHDVRRQIRDKSQNYVSEIYRDGYITKPARRNSEQMLANNIVTEAWDLKEYDTDQRRLYNMHKALGLEYKAYQLLYERGILPELLVMELKKDAAKRRERLSIFRTLPDDATLMSEFLPRYSNTLLQILESVLVRMFRGKTWLEGIIASLQTKRLEQELKHVMAVSMAYRFVITALDNSDDQLSKEIQQFYRKLDNEVLSRLRTLNRQFPRFATWVEQYLAIRSALQLQLVELDKFYEQGEISYKPYSLLHREVEDAIRNALNFHRTPPKIRRTPLLQNVPLFSELSIEDLESLASVSRLLYYLPGDDIIRIGESGSSLYVVANGQVEVLDRDDKAVAQLSKGDFFGEIALLWDSKRTATVRAVIPSTLLCLHRKKLLDVSSRNERLRNILDRAARERSQSTATENKKPDAL